jgi:hypothetical protein
MHLVRRLPTPSTHLSPHISAVRRNIAARTPLDSWRSERSSPTITGSNSPLYGRRPYCLLKRLCSRTSEWCRTSIHQERAPGTMVYGIHEVRERVVTAMNSINDLIKEKGHLPHPLRPGKPQPPGVSSFGGSRTILTGSLGFTLTRTESPSPAASQSSRA